MAVHPITYVINANPGGNRKALQTDSSFANQNLNAGLTSVGTNQKRGGFPYAEPTLNTTKSSKLGGT